MSRSSRVSLARGFTLVEMLIIAPIALLVITGFVALMITMVGDVIASRAQNVMAYDTQSAVNMIDQDVKLSTQFLNTSGSMLSPQGKDGATAAFTSTAGDLVLGEITTDKNPIDPTRGFVYYNAPFGCSDPTKIYKNRIYYMTVVYTVRNGSLWRRTYVPIPSGTLCQTPWQINTCAPNYLSSDTRCQSNDSEILKGVKNFSVEYYANPQDTATIPASSATSAESIKVTIEGETTAAGRTVGTTSSGRSTKLSKKDITVAPPDSPVVSGSVTDSQATFTWPSVPTATSYWVQYNVNGGAWITASESSPITTFSAPGFRNDTISVKVYARNATGTSADAASNNASVTIPLWTDCALQNGWVNYGSTYESCGYTITKYGVVMFKGSIKNGTTTTGTTLFQLPDNLRPPSTQIFQMPTDPSYTRIDVQNDGLVRTGASSSANYIALDGIYFIPKNSLYTWSTPTLLNGWSSYSGPYTTLQTTLDAGGRVHTRGVIQQGTYTSGTPIAQLPTGQTTSEYLHLPARGSSFNLIGVDETGKIVARGTSSTFISLQTMFYPSTYSGWQSFSGSVSGNPADNQLGNSWVYYGSPNATPQYTKSADGIVTIKGLIKNGTAVEPTTMARLPAGYRPRKTLHFSTTSSAGSARVYVEADGDIVFGRGSSTWMSLSNISFIAEQ